MPPVLFLVLFPEQVKLPLLFGFSLLAVLDLTDRLPTY